MTYLKNSTRSLYKATYESKQNDSSSNANVVEKKSLLANWMVTEKELDAIKGKTSDLTPAEKKKIKDALEIIKPIVTAGDSVEAIKLSSKLATVDNKTLVKIGVLLSKIRKAEQHPAKITKGAKLSPSTQPATVVTSIDVLNSTHQFEERMKKSQYGWLHLEQLDMKPSGKTVEGELLYSLPLAPHEKVILTHKEWSSQSKDLEKVVSDVLETSEEQSVEDKRDTSMSTESQSQISTAFAVSGGYTGFGFSSSINYGQNTNQQVSQKVSEQHATNLTKKASARARKEHKTTIKVSSASGLEDSSERVVVNNYSDHVLQLDYHRQMREWEVTLTRSGMRLAYDIVLPNPAKDIVQKHMELKKIEDELLKALNFDLIPSEINENNYLEFAGLYGATIDGYPQPAESIFPRFENLASESDEKWEFIKPMEVIVPPGNLIDETTLDISFFLYDDKTAICKFADTAIPDQFGPHNGHNRYYSIPSVRIPHFTDRTGKFHFYMYWMYTLQIYVQLNIRFKLKPEKIREWQIGSWQKLYNAAQESHERRKQEMEERKAKLLEEISADDALALRGREREEVMKRIISFLFGINFSVENQTVRGAGSVIVLNPTASSILEGYNNVPETAESGEIINFLSHVIEWENVVYVLYPYFWANNENRKYKMFLHHPDKMHRDFLRAGAARVVLTVRRGFENAFVAAMNYGLQAGLATEFPEITIGDQLQTEAWKRYKDMPPEKGEHSRDNFPPPNEEEIPKPFATWTEYMPTSGVRVKATKIKVKEE